MTSGFPECEKLLINKKFDILWNGKPTLDVYFKFLANGKMESNQTMFNGQPWRAVKNNQFAAKRKNDSEVLWQFKDKTGQEAFRTDRKHYGMRLSKNQDIAVE